MPENPGRHGPRTLPRDHRPPVKGVKIEIVQQDVKPFVFTFGEVDVEAEHEFDRLCDGAALKSGEIHTDSGHRFWALLELDALSSHEHRGTGIAAGVDHELAFSWHGRSRDHERWLQSIRSQDPCSALTPYSYRHLDASVRGRDHHVGEDGWSSHGHRPRD